jgi:hypothetical protein
MINDLNISISGFRLLKIKNSMDLTTAEYKYESCPEDLNGGIQVIPNSVNLNVKSGIFFITQICTYHTLKIESNNKWSCFESRGEKFKDTHSPSECHCSNYKIKDNKIFDPLGILEKKIEFWDAPYLELQELWTEIDYDIKFETWFQYKDDKDQRIVPMLSFQWFLKANAKKNRDTWVIVNESHSDKEDIRKSLKTHDPNEDGVSPCNLRQLNSTIRDHIKTNT